MQHPPFPQKVRIAALAVLAAIGWFALLVLLPLVSVLTPA